MIDPRTASSVEKSRSHKPYRKISIDGTHYVVTHGLRAHFWQDIYHSALVVRWPTFFACAGLFFLILNAAFAWLYSCGDHPIANQAPAGFLGAFFFSVETLATVGYGDMHPDSLYGHSVATLEIFVGMSSVALATGMIFARFSRPRARIMFARHPVVHTVDGRTTLMVRAANERQNVIVEATARMRLLRSEFTQEGVPIRRIYDLPLRREHHPIFLIGWSIMHVIDEHSPLYGETIESLARVQATLLLMVEGVDETTMQPMQARVSWSHEEIRWQHRYVDLMYEEDGITHLDYTAFHDVTPVVPSQ
ncbi:MAG: ion channel [Janthinobacterium lividum]